MLMTCSWLAGPAHGIDLDKTDVYIHGFGGWAYGVTDGNRYLIGNEDGKADNVQLSLNITVKPHERFSIVTQVDFEQQEDLETELDFAFVEINPTGNLKVRLGRVKHAFGLYAEVFDVGTIRPFYLLPQSIYGAQGVTTQSVDGVGLRNGTYGDRWSVEWDLYAGEFDGEIRVPGPISSNPADFFLSEAVSAFEVKDVIGGRLNVLPPVEGLSFGISAYAGTQTIESIASTTDQDYDVWGAHLEFLRGPWSFRTEFSHFELDSGRAFEADGFYSELAYRVDDHWQVGLRYDWWEGEAPSLAGVPLPPFAGQFFENTDLGLALNYWFSESLVIRLNAHRVDGNRFAFPLDSADIQQVFATGMLEDETWLFVLGTQFSF